MYSTEAPPDLPQHLVVKAPVAPIDVGARDLAFFMALHWYPNRRRELEPVLLKRYYDCLLEYGLESYSFDELWLDYRRSIIRSLTIPILF